MPDKQLRTGLVGIRVHIQRKTGRKEGTRVVIRTHRFSSLVEVVRILESVANVQVVVPPQGDKQIDFAVELIDSNGQYAVYLGNYLTLIKWIGKERRLL